MKIFIFTVALLSASSLPVHAGSVWLLLREMTGTFAIDFEKIEMESMEQCEIQGAMYVASKRLGERYSIGVGFECLEGK